MFNPVTKTFQYGDQTVTLETGKVARQATGSVVVSMGNTRFTIEDMKLVNEGNFYLNTSWEKCASETAAKFSAVAYFFGQKLFETLNVPIGLIQNVVGGSPAKS